MKVCILGPIPNESHFGGVATFDNGLKSGFLENGDEVLIVTNVKCDNKNTVYFSKLDFIFRRNKIVKEIINFNPNIVISSMWYGLLNKKIKKILDTKIIHFIHGFPTYRYGIYKKYILNAILKETRKNTDYFIANSAFTACINNEIYGIKCDKSIHIAIEEGFVDFNKISNNKTKILFVGRIVKEKNVDKICKLFEFIYTINSNIELTIVGDGPEKAKLEKIYSENININFVGKKNRNETLEYLANSDIFISLNPHEPFGLVYLEAMLMKCKIICPNTGGQVEFLRDINEALLIDINNYNDRKDEIRQFLKSNAYENTDLNKFFSYYNYKRVIKELIELD